MTTPITTLTGPRSGVEWLNLFDPDQPDSSAARLTQWSHEYLTQPHDELGRPGPVCPFISQAVAKCLLWATFLDGDVGVSTLDTVVDDMYDRFVHLTTISDWKRPHALITVLAELSDHTVIDEVHAARKTQFVERGFMLGQFYPGCSQPGLWNHDFHPLDTPWPMIVARNMMTTDLPFLIARTDWLRAYFKTFAPGLPTALRCRLADDLCDHGDAVADITANHALVGSELAR